MTQKPTEAKSSTSWVWHAFKILAIAAAAFVVSQHVQWYDSVEKVDGTVVEGSLESGLAPEATAIRILDREGNAVELDEGEWTTGTKVIGLRSTFTRLNAAYLAAGMMLLLSAYALGIWRWKILLRTQGIPATYLQSFRLTFIGFFCNNFIPGLTGGDVIKAIYIARDTPDKRSEAVSTVMVDRVIGLMALVLLTSAAILANIEKFREQGVIIFTILGIAVLGIFCYFSPPIRRLLRIEKLIQVLPGSAILVKIDRAFLLYRSKPKIVIVAFALSALSHTANIASVSVLGSDLAIPLGFFTYLATVPLILIASSIPIFPAGWGVREVLFIHVFLAIGIDEAYTSQLLVLSVLLGSMALLWSFVGGLFLLADKKSA